MTDTNIENMGFLVHDVARLLRRHFEARGREYGLSAAQWRAVVRIVKYGPMTQAKLAEVLEIEPISVSRLIDRMEQAGWAERRPDENDRRANVVHPTERAVAAFAEVKLMAGDIYETALDGLNENERRTLMKALETMTNNLAKAETTAEEAEPIKQQVAR